MTVNFCPNCSGRIDLPEGASAADWVRCPICGAEYQLQRVLEFRPPCLEVIDEPAMPSLGRMPSWGAVATATGVPAAALAASEIAAPLAVGNTEDSDILAVQPSHMGTEPISSVDVGEDADVITFDDSLLLDEPTETLPRVQMTGTDGDVDGSPMEMSDADFFDSIADEPQAANEMQPAPAGDWEVDDMLEINQSTSNGNKSNVDAPGDPNEWSDLQGSHATPTVAAGAIGMTPRRKARGKNPVVMIGGIVVGGVMGLAIGYAILMWVFTKDPFSLASQLPDFLVPTALKTAGNSRVAQFAPTNGGVNSGGSASGSADGGMSENVNPADSGQQADNTKQDPAGPFGNPFAGADAALDSKPTVDKADDQRKKATDSNDSNALPEPTIDPFTRQTSEATEAGKSESPTTTTLPDPFNTTSNQKEPLDSTLPPIDPFAEGKGTDSKERAKKAASATGAKGTAADTSTDPFGGKEAAEPVVTNAPDDVGPKSSHVFSSQELMAAVEESHKTTQAAVTLPANADQKQKNAANGRYYMQLSKVAEALTFVDGAGDPQSKEKATNAAVTVFLDAAPDVEHLNEIGKLAGYWIKSESRPGNGIVLSGMVTETKQQGKLVESVVETLGKPARITVVSPSTLTDDPGRPVLVAGSIVKDPATNLHGYTGTTPTVVWAAMAIDPSESAQSRGRSDATKESGAGKDSSGTADANNSAAAPPATKE